MKLLNLYWLLLLFSLFFFLQAAKSQPDYKKNFTNERLRLEFVMKGNADTLIVNSASFYREGPWGGNPYQLIDPFDYGEMRMLVFDSTHNKLVFSRGFSSLFVEWQTTQSARFTDTSFVETQAIPFPKKPIRIDIQIRKENHFFTVKQLFFNPEETGFVDTEPSEGMNTLQIVKSGNAGRKVDLLILADGFTQEQQEYFFREARSLTQALFLWEPYASHQDDFNVTAVFFPSEDTGADIPADSVYVNTALNSSFYTFGSERYLTSINIPGIYKKVAGIPYDQICIMVNTDRYGGGAIYNNFTFFSTDTLFSEFLFLHEFAHAFASLADEYYTSSVSYLDYFSYKTEPYHPNITTLVNFDSKWEKMLAEGTPVPTPDSTVYNGKVGVFEGGGYSAKGIYRPARTCAMKDKTTLYFCPVCINAIEEMIFYYTEK